MTLQNQAKYMGLHDDDDTCCVCLKHYPDARLQCLANPVPLAIYGQSVTWRTPSEKFDPLGRTYYIYILTWYRLRVFSFILRNVFGILNRFTTHRAPQLQCCKQNHPSTHVWVLKAINASRLRTHHLQQHDK